MEKNMESKKLRFMMSLKGLGVPKSTREGEGFQRFTVHSGVACIVRIRLFLAPPGFWATTILGVSQRYPDYPLREPVRCVAFEI